MAVWRDCNLRSAVGLLAYEGIQAALAAALLTSIRFSAHTSDIGSRERLGFTKARNRSAPSTVTCSPKLGPCCRAGRVPICISSALDDRLLLLPHRRARAALRC